MGPIIRIPRRRRSSAAKSVPQISVKGGAALPSGVVGVIKRLSRLDTKGFRGEPGTPYVSLPSDLLPHLPTVKSGRNAEPRWDVLLYARLHLNLGVVIDSGSNSTNITGVGYGSRRTSHKDLRLNMLRVVVHGIEYSATSVGEKSPRQGDVLVVEFVPGQDALRLTFVTDDPLKTKLSSICGSKSWAWLSSGVMPRW